MFDKLAEAIHGILYEFDAVRKHTFGDYSVLETAIDNNPETPMFATKNGGVVTFIHLDGLKTIISNGTYQQMVIDRLSRALESNFKKKGHFAQFCFQYDPERRIENIDKILEGAYDACDKLGLDLKYMVDDRKRNLIASRLGAEEKNFLILWTMPEVLSAQEKQEESEARFKEFKDRNLPLGGSANPFVAYKGILDKHKAFVSNVCNELSLCSIDYGVMNIPQSCREMRQGVESLSVSEDWKPKIAGDYYLPVMQGSSDKSEYWNVLPKTLPNYIFKTDAEPVGNKLVKVGNRVYAPMFFSEMGTDIYFFSGLFSKLIRYPDMGWRIIFSLGGGGVDEIQTKRAVAGIISVLSPRNRQFKNAADSMAAYVESGGTAVRLQVSACTWGNTPEEASKNSAQLMQSLESWGSPSISTASGNPILNLASASIGFSPKQIGGVACAPIDNALQMLPLSRSAQIWKQGSMLYQFADGKLAPYQAMSHLQASFATGIVGIPGYGKSATMALNHFAFVVDPQNQSLPYISILDYDYSSSGFIETIKNSLPEEQKKLVQFIRLSNTPKYCVNPNDTFPGCRFPFEAQIAYLVGLFTTGMTDPSSGAAPKGISNFLLELINKVFETYSDCYKSFPVKPKLYSDGFVTSVSNALKKIGFKPVSEAEIQENIQNNIPDERSPTTWWEVVDRLNNYVNSKGEHEYRDIAIIAQRYAVPVLNDYITVARQNEHIKNSYGSQMIDGEPLIEVFCRSMQNIIETYKIISGVTQFDLGDARIVSLDLFEVAKNNTNIEKVQATLMYMFGTNLVASKFMLNPDQQAEVPVKHNVQPNTYTNINLYKKWFVEYATNIGDTRKRFCIDELHIPISLEAMETYIVNIARLLRKRNTELMVATQSIQDVPQRLRSNLTTLNILSPATEDDLAIYKKEFNVNEPGEIYALQKGIVAPGAHGSTMVAIFLTNKGRYAQFLRNKASAVELWAASTTRDDVVLIRAVTNIVHNSVMARKILAKAYPNGSAKDDIAKRKLNMKEDVQDNVYEIIAREKVNLYGNFV